MIPYGVRGMRRFRMRRTSDSRARLEQGVHRRRCATQGGSMSCGRHGIQQFKQTKRLLKSVKNMLDAAFAQLVALCRLGISNSLHSNTFRVLQTSRKEKDCGHCRQLKTISRVSRVGLPSPANGSANVIIQTHSKESRRWRRRKRCPAPIRKAAYYGFRRSEWYRRVRFVLPRSLLSTSSSPSSRLSRQNGTYFS